MNALNYIEKFRNTKPVYEEAYFRSFFYAFFMVVAFIFYILVLITIATDDEGLPYQKDTELLAYFEEAQERADTGVILLGNSRVRHATGFGLERGDIRELPDGRKMAVLQYAENAAEFKSYKDFEADILHARPEYLFIGKEILSNKRRESGNLINYSGMVYKYFSEQRGKKSAEDIWREQRHDIEKCVKSDYTRRMMNIRIESTKIRDDHSLDPRYNENLEQVRSFIARTRKAGIKVVILHIMPNLEILDRFNVPVHLLDAYGIGHEPMPEELLPEQYDDVVWLTYRDKAGNDHYCDFVHLNEKGRPVFEEWFMKAIADGL